MIQFGPIKLSPIWVGVVMSGIVHVGLTAAVLSGTWASSARAAFEEPEMIKPRGQSVAVYMSDARPEPRMIERERIVAREDQPRAPQAPSIETTSALLKFAADLDEPSFNSTDAVRIEHTPEHETADSAPTAEPADAIQVAEAPLPEPVIELPPIDVPTPVVETASTEPASPNSRPVDQGVTSGAVVMKLVDPVYPNRAVRRNIEGDVLVLVEVLATGVIGDVSVSESSGHAMLDRAAVNAARRCLFKPAKNNGTPIRSEIEVPFEFRIRSSLD